MTKKSDLRKKYISKRKNISGNFLNKAEKSLLSIFSTELNLSKKKVACYASIGNEFPTKSILNKLLENDCEVYLPSIDSHSKILKFLKLDEEENLIKNRFGILEPKSTYEIYPSELDIIFLPCVCFDLKGFRVGMGAGYYDHSLTSTKNSNCKLITLAYEFQKVIDCYPEEHDIRSHACLTEDRYYKFD
ncbi:MAG: 5-formyltetrahydrofolate cyclo-ligase [Gammaproteobacteria bacterium]|jgi:5-formyltetrahydrofolate cyclo-ligase|tara:strand:- start:181 stop:747 length:567 start_codon:yes stop_codon:yes gene_type:complete